jgi:hypothetical protein
VGLLAPLAGVLLFGPDAWAAATPTPTATQTVTVPFDFEGLGDFEAVSNFYNGGTGGNGSGPGPNLIVPAVPRREIEFRER